MRIYITHCSAKKDNSLRNSGKQVTPCKLYTATPTQRFMTKCQEKKVNWAIFSDLHGVWFPNVEHEWYEKDPNTVTEEGFVELVKDFDEKLDDYDGIYFYHNPRRFHTIYKELLREPKLKDKNNLIQSPRGDCVGVIRCLTWRW